MIEIVIFLTFLFFFIKAMKPEPKKIKWKHNPDEDFEIGK